MTESGPSVQNYIKNLIVPTVLILATAIGVMTFIRWAADDLEHHHGHSKQPSMNGGLSFSPLDGSESVGLDDMNAKLVLVNFWASWCTPCLKEIPSLVKLREKFRDQGLEVALVNVDANSSRAAPPVLKRFGVDFRTYTDAGQNLSEKFDVTGLPLTVVVNKNEEVLLKVIGERNWFDQKVQSQVQEWLQ